LHDKSEGERARGREDENIGMGEEEKQGTRDKKFTTIRL